MSKHYKTIISRYAEDDLIEIIEYYVVKNESYAQKLLISLEARVEELKTLPERGRVVWNLSDLVETKLSLSENKRRRGYGNEETDLHGRVQTQCA